MYNQNNAYSTGNDLVYGLNLRPLNFSEPTLLILKGKVVDITTNKPLSAAHVYYTRNNKKFGVITDQNGNYELEAASNDIIKISFMGYDGIEDYASKVGEIEYLTPKAEQLKTVYLTNKKPINKNLLLGIGGVLVVIIGVSISKNKDNAD